MRESGRESFETWARSRQQGLVRTAYLLTGDFHRAEDLVQDALVKAAARWDTLAGGHPDAWVRTVVYRDQVSWWRRHRREVFTSSDGTRVTAEVANATGDQRTSPLVDEAVAVGLGLLKHVDDQGNSQTGVAVVDRHSGRLLAFLPTQRPGPDADPTYLLALNGDRVTLAVGLEDGSRILVWWSWRTGVVTPVAVLRAGMISGAP